MGSISVSFSLRLMRLLILRGAAGNIGGEGLTIPQPSDLSVLVQLFESRVLLGGREQLGTTARGQRLMRQSPGFDRAALNMWWPWNGNQGMADVGTCCLPVRFDGGEQCLRDL